MKKVLLSLLAMLFAIVTMGQEFNSRNDCEETSVDTTYFVENSYVMAWLIHYQACEVYDHETKDIGNLYRSFPTKDTLFIAPKNIDLYDSDIESLLSGKTISKPVLLESSFMEGIDIGKKFHLNKNSFTLDEEKDPLPFLLKLFGPLCFIVLLFFIVFVNYSSTNKNNGFSWFMIIVLFVVVFLFPIVLFNQTKELFPFKWLYYFINFGSTSLYVVFLIFLQKFKIGQKIKKWSIKRYAEKP